MRPAEFKKTGNGRGAADETQMKHRWKIMKEIRNAAVAARFG
jgi:hypothetical protein